MYFYMLCLGILGGVCFGIQGPVNTALGKRTDVFQASLISFFGGMIISGLIAIFLGKGDFFLLKEVKVLQCLGGIYGIINVCVTVAAIPVLGAALSFTLIMLGQILSGAVIDFFGLFGSFKTQLSISRIFGILIIIIGVILIYFGSIKKSEKEVKSNKLKIFFMIISSLIAGILGAMQSPTNASLAKLIGNWEGTFISFFVGTLALILVVLIKNKGRLKTMKNVGIKPWMMIGGSYGVLGIFLNLYTVQFLGTTLLVSCTMIGQLSAGLIIDTFGLIQTKKVKINFIRIAGIIVIAIGILLA